MFKVCLVDDDFDAQVLVADWLRVCRRLQLLATYASGEEALREIPKVRPDITLMDIKMSGMSGIECLAALRRISPALDCSVVMLTDYDDNALVFDALKAGADGYLLKRHASGKELEAAIVEVMAGGGPMSPSIAHKVIGFFQTHQPIHWPGLGQPGQPEQATIPLTAREEEVLNFARRGLTYKEIAGGLNVSLDTVRKHFRNIYYKLHIHSRCDPRLYAASRQYLARRQH